MDIGVDGDQKQHKPWHGLMFLVGGLILIGWLFNTPHGLLGKADAVGYAVCHRIDLHSFFLDDRQIPLCARCTGMYLGAVSGLVYQFYVGSRRTGSPPKRVIAVLIGLVGAFILDGTNSFLHFIPGLENLYPPSNTLRLLTGTGMGLVMAIAIYPAFNQTIWRMVDERPSISGMQSLLILMALSAIIAMAVLSENPLLLYPLALISAGGVLILLTMIYCIVWLMIFRHENRVERASQVLIPVSAGFFTGLVHIGLLNLARFYLTGSWEGFHIG
jgi:uncharacterized membrane protein